MTEMTEAQQATFNRIIRFADISRMMRSEGLTAYVINENMDSGAGPGDVVIGHRGMNSYSTYIKPDGRVVQIDQGRATIAYLRQYEIPFVENEELLRKLEELADLEEAYFRKLASLGIKTHGTLYRPEDVPRMLYIQEKD